MELQAIEFLSITIPLSSEIMMRGTLILGAVLSVISLVFQDYSVFFPQHLRMNVFFDQPGLAASVEALGQIPGDGCRLKRDSRQYRDDYFRMVDEQIASLDGPQGFFGVRGANVHSTGNTSFVVERVAGLQRYCVTEAAGELEHCVEVPGREQARLLTFFERIPSGGDYLQMSIRRPGRVLLCCRFKQMLATDKASTRAPFRLMVVGLTRVDVWPWPRFSNTVYCADFDAGGLVPVAYAVYK
jgi:hypothetical protein